MYSIDGKHDDDSLSENVVVLFNKYYCKSHMSQSLRVAVSDSGRVDGSHDTDWLRPHYLPFSGRVTYQTHRLRAASTFQCLAEPASLSLSVRRWYNTKTQVKL